MDRFTSFSRVVLFNKIKKPNLKMDRETFALRKIILEEFYKNRIKLVYYDDITIEQETDINPDILTNGIVFKTNVKVFNCNILNITTKEVYKLLKPFVYYLFSLTYKRKFVREETRLFNESINIYFSYHSITSTTISVNSEINIGFSIEPFEDNSFLEDYDVESFYEDSKIKSLDNDYIHYLELNLRTYYVFENYEDYIETVADLEENGEIDITDNEEEKIINSSQVFKSEECTICLTNPPQVLFCNCGHLCICTECDKVKTLKICPVCKTENTILRLIE